MESDDSGTKSELIYKVFFLVFVVIGASISLGAVLDFSDMMILSCGFPNIIGCLFLLPILKVKLEEYWARYQRFKYDY